MALCLRTSRIWPSWEGPPGCARCIGAGRSAARLSIGDVGDLSPPPASDTEGAVLRLSYDRRMPTLTVKVSEAALVELRREAQARSLSVSELVRQRLGVSVASGQQDERLDDLERRLARLEAMAGL